MRADLMLSSKLEIRNVDDTRLQCSSVGREDKNEAFYMAVCVMIKTLHRGADEKFPCFIQVQI